MGEGQLMNITQNLSQQLIKKNIQPSHQRIKVLEYLHAHQCHPTVDQIYNSLKKDVPTLSKSTVYNTLNTFVQAGLVKELHIEDHETRYDIITENHGHFKCESCGTIYNFAINMDDFFSEELNNFRVHDKNVYFKGICPKCLCK
jgi:Fur family transcriptional regulator, peroxide stress response regulator